MEYGRGERVDDLFADHRAIVRHAAQRVRLGVHKLSGVFSQVQ